MNFDHFWPNPCGEISYKQWAPHIARRTGGLVINYYIFIIIINSKMWWYVQIHMEVCLAPSLRTDWWISPATGSQSLIDQSESRSGVRWWRLPWVPMRAGNEEEVTASVWDLGISVCYTWKWWSSVAIRQKTQVNNLHCGRLKLEWLYLLNGTRYQQTDNGSL